MLDVVLFAVKTLLASSLLGFRQVTRFEVHKYPKNTRVSFVSTFNAIKKGRY